MAKKMPTETPNLKFQSPEQALKTLRMLWFGFVTGTIALFCGGGLFAVQGLVPMPADTQALLFKATVLAFIFGPMVGFYFRMQAYKRGYVVDRVTPQAYMRGNMVVFWILGGVALLLGVTLAGAGVRAFQQCTLMLVFLLLLLALNFPTGKPMERTPPALANK